MQVIIKVKSSSTYSAGGQPSKHKVGAISYLCILGFGLFDGEFELFC